MITLKCRTCQSDFQLPDWAARRSKGFCSRQCAAQSKAGKPRYDNRKRSVVKCVVCGEKFEVGGKAGSRAKRFCSWDCRNAARYRHGARAEKLSDLDAAYIAGLVDGEGSIFLHNRRDVAALRLTVSNTKRAVLDWLVSVVGVGVVTRQRPRSGEHAASYYYNANSEAAETIIEQIAPYLRIKQRQAKLAMETQVRLRDPKRKADRVWQLKSIGAMRQLNKRGG